MDSTSNTENSHPNFVQPTPEYPTKAQLKSYGDLMFLYMRIRAYDNVPMRQIRLNIQPPIDLGFHKIFYRNAVPRAAVTWAFLGPQQENAFVKGLGLKANDWISGRQLWITEIYAPYGQGTARDVFRWLMATVSKEHNIVRWTRMKGGKLHRIVESRRKVDRLWTHHPMSVDQFLKAESAASAG